MLKELSLPSPRQITNRLTQPFAKELHRRYPNLSPNHLTFFGLCGVGLSLLANRHAQINDNPKLRNLGLGLYLTASSLDAFDGALAREFKANGDNHNTDKGQIVDVVADRLSEGLSAAARIASAPDSVGVISAGLVGATNIFPSLYRAKAEAQGKQPPESGSNLFGFLGTRAGRLIPATIATFFPEINSYQLQPPLDMIAAIANITTAVQRKRISQDETIMATLDQDKVEAAVKREKTLAVLNKFGVAIFATLTAYHLLSKKE